MLERDTADEIGSHPRESAAELMAMSLDEIRQLPGCQCPGDLSFCVDCHATIRSGDTFWHGPDGSADCWDSPTGRHRPASATLADSTAVAIEQILGA